MTTLSIHKTQFHISLPNFVRRLYAMMDQRLLQAKVERKLRDELSQLSQNNLRDIGLTLQDVSAFDQQDFGRIAQVRRENW